MNKSQQLAKMFERYHTSMEKQEADVLTMYIDPADGKGSFAIKFNDSKGLAWLLYHAIKNHDDFKDFFKELMALHLSEELASNERSN